MRAMPGTAQRLQKKSDNELCSLENPWQVTDVSLPRSKFAKHCEVTFFFFFSKQEC